MPCCSTGCLQFDKWSVWIEADSMPQMDEVLLADVEKSCEVAEMEEVKLGNDSFYYVWEDTGNLHTLSHFSFTFSPCLSIVDWILSCCSLEGIISFVEYHLKDRGLSTWKGEKHTSQQIKGTTKKTVLEPDFCLIKLVRALKTPLSVYQKPIITHWSTEHWTIDSEACFQNH